MTSLQTSGALLQGVSITDVLQTALRLVGLRIYHFGVGFQAAGRLRSRGLSVFRSAGRNASLRAIDPCPCRLRKPSLDNPATARNKVVHGAAVSPDDRYAFISVEGVGSEPGTLEIIDLETLKTVATVDVPEQAAGIDFWKMEPVK